MKWNALNEDKSGKKGLYILERTHRRRNLLFPFFFLILVRIEMLEQEKLTEWRLSQKNGWRFSDQNWKERVYFWDSTLKRDIMVGSLKGGSLSPLKVITNFDKYYWNLLGLVHFFFRFPYHFSIWPHYLWIYASSRLLDYRTRITYFWIETGTETIHLYK